MQRVALTLLLMLSALTGLKAQTITDEIRQKLTNAPVQEKVYLHLDNRCYYKGDTIWYKAYVVRADSLTYTDMSRILYVELVAPDGMVVERQQIILSSMGYSNGNFALMDSIYSGYYELRAYTRWMLNFKISEHEYSRKDREYFYNKKMAQDFFRQFGTIYSRVVPVYERPEEEGDYAMKYIVNRPKTRLDKELKERLNVQFYPEGGHLVAGKRCRVAFEATDEEGRQVEITGKIGQQTIRTEHEGKGAFFIDVPQNGGLTAEFKYHGKDYHIDLPKAERNACALTLTTNGKEATAHFSMGHYLPGLNYMAAVLCRGVLKTLCDITPNEKGEATLHMTLDSLPTGVCDLIVADELGQPLADRLFFVNHHDYDEAKVEVDGFQSDRTYEPYEMVTLHFKAPAQTNHISIAVRDGATDDPTYDTGNMLTDMLLSSELQGFIPHPDYYFEKDDDTHRHHLDLLMMVQGWRRYDYKEITGEPFLRYKPETAMTIEGTVYPTPDSDTFEPDEVRYWALGIFGYSPSAEEANANSSSSLINQEEGMEQENDINRYKATTPDELVDQMRSGAVEAEVVGSALYVQDNSNPKSAFDPFFGINHGGLNHEVTVVGELVFEDDIATIEMETDNGGHYAFSVPPYYGQAILFMNAHDTDISEKKAKRLSTKGVIDETDWPEYYVKRDLFYPVFAKKYSYYQCHQPDDDENDSAMADTSEEAVDGKLSKFDRELQEVTVKKKRHRGRRAIDYSKPACVYDTQWLYNLATDRGLSFGRYEADRFPMQVAMALLGNYNSYRPLQVMARLNDREIAPYVYYRNFDPGPTVTEQNRSDAWINRNIMMKRQDEVRLYTDFDLRNEDRDVEQQSMAADVTLDLLLMPDEGMRYTYRDRRMILDGMTEAADFYHPDYEHRALPDQPKDYRRTLYWNPNARLDDMGRFSAVFYNNGKQTRIHVSAAGLTKDGKPVTCDM